MGTNFRTAIESLKFSFSCAYFQSSEDNIALADRWFDGLVNKDVDISKEIYSLSEVDFDRQVSSDVIRRSGIIFFFGFSGV